MKINKKLCHLLESIANSPKHDGLESDGLSYLLNYRLTEEAFTAEHFTGTVTYNGITIDHDWLTHKGLIIDYRLKMWFGERAEEPHGVFDPSEWPTLQYQIKIGQPMMPAVDYYNLVSQRKPLLLRGVPGIVPPENLTQGRWDYLQKCGTIAKASGPLALQKCTTLSPRT